MSNNDFSLLFQVDKLGPNPKRIHIEATEQDLSGLKERFDLKSMDVFKGQALLQRLSGKKIEVKYTAQATFKQECVITFKTIENKVNLEFRRIYDGALSEDCNEKEIEIDIESTEELDPIIDGVIDLGADLSEELGLEIDPFPRAEGTEFNDFGVGPEITEEEVKANNPFSVLADLKNKSEE